MAYLTYKGLTGKIIASYFGNKKLIDSEKDREKELINNIGESVRHHLIEQHQNALKTDNKIDNVSDKKIEQVVKLVTSHLLKGNDFKLLTLPVFEDEEEANEKEEQKKDLRKVSSDVRQAIKTLATGEITKLLEIYAKEENQKE